MSNSELKAAADELREITKGMQESAELMTEAAGVTLGAWDGIALEKGKARVEAAILVAAGADASRNPVLDPGRR